MFQVTQLHTQSIAQQKQAHHLAVAAAHRLARETRQARASSPRRTPLPLRSLHFARSAAP